MARAETLTLSGIPRVDLMPRSEVERRQRERLTRAWLWGVLAAILVAVAVIAGAFALKWLADQALAAEQAKTNELLVELSTLSEVNQALMTEQELTAYRSLAGGTDLAWAPLISSTVQLLPPDVTLTGFELAVGGVPSTDDPESETGLVGSLTFVSPTPIDIVATIRNVRTAPGVLAADGQEVTASSVSEGQYQYKLTITYDQTIYSGAFAAQEGND